MTKSTSFAALLLAASCGPTSPPPPRPAGSCPESCLRMPVDSWSLDCLAKCEDLPDGWWGHLDAGDGGR